MRVVWEGVGVVVVVVVVVEGGHPGLGGLVFSSIFGGDVFLGWGLVLRLMSGDKRVSGYLRPRDVVGFWASPPSGHTACLGFILCYFTGSSGQHTMRVALSTCRGCSAASRLQPWWAEDMGAMTFYCRPLATPGLDLRVRMELDGTLGGSDD